MKKILLFPTVCTLFALSSCTTKVQPEQAVAALVQPTVGVATTALPPKTAQRCFEMTDKMKGKTLLQISIDKIKVTGTMNWTAANGERVTGTLTGTIDAQNLMRCTYAHRAQGKKYTNERFFKLLGKTVVEGEGEQKADANGVFRYKNPEKVQYKRTMTEVQCT